MAKETMTTASLDLSTSKQIRLNDGRSLAYAEFGSPQGRPLMFFHGTGWVQFGPRYLLDTMPFLIVLAVFGMRGRLTRWSIALIALSIMINAWGTWRFCIERP